MDLMIRPALLAAAISVCLGGQSAAADYLEIGVDELLVRLPLMFGDALVVEGPLDAWGEFAALDSETGRELMVDLRKLGPETHAQVDRACTHDKPCAARIEGTIIHIRGTGISELGLEADTVEIR